MLWRDGWIDNPTLAVTLRMPPTFRSAKGQARICQRSVMWIARPTSFAALFDAIAKVGIPPSTLEFKIRQLRIEKQRFITPPW